MLGIIGGTGLYKLEGLAKISTERIYTPFGDPSSEIITGEFEGTKVAFLPRHGIQHQILPSEINFRANIWALKSLGVRQIVSVSAVGSLQEKVRPGEIALPNQYFDWTKGKRAGTFFGSGLVGHVSTAQPTCPALSRALCFSAGKLEVEVHRDKTYACVEGPRLGTRAESLFLRQVGCDLVGMTNVPEAHLAREAQLCYCTIAVVTDFDCWMDDPEAHASVEKIIELYHKSIGRVQELIRELIRGGHDGGACDCRSSLKCAVLTKEEALSKEQKQILVLLRE